jgi:hypothetical protein
MCGVTLQNYSELQHSNHTTNAKHAHTFGESPALSDLATSTPLLDQSGSRGDTINIPLFVASLLHCMFPPSGGVYNN